MIISIKNTFVILLITLLVSCEANIDLNNISKEVSGGTSIILPIGTVDVKIGEGILTYYRFDDINVNDSSEITYQFSDSTEFAYKPLNLLKNAATFNENYLLTLANTLNYNPNTILPAIKSAEELNLGLNQNTDDEQIDSVLIRSAVFSVVINKTNLAIPEGNITAKIKFDNNKIKLLTLGSTSERIINPQFFGSPINFELNNFIYYASNSSNTLPFTIEFNIVSGSETLVVDFTSSINFEMKIENLTYKYAYGYFSPAIFPTKTEQFEFNIERFLPDGLFKLANPKIDVKLQSNIGTYLNYNLEYFKALNTNDISYEPVFAWYNNHTTQSYKLDLGKKPKKPGDWISKDFKTFDKDFGETYRLFENEKRSNTLEIKYTVGINKELVNNDPSPSFITDDPKFKYKFTMTVPFSLNNGSYYELNDSASGGFDKIGSFIQNKLLNIDSLYLVLNITNGLPIKSTFNLQFVDSLGKEILIDLVKNYTLNSGNINENGIVKTDEKQTILIKLTAEQLKTLGKVTKMYYKIRLDGKDMFSKIHFTPLNHINIKTAIFLNFKVNSSL